MVGAMSIAHFVVNICNPWLIPGCPDAGIHWSECFECILIIIRLHAPLPLSLHFWIVSLKGYIRMSSPKTLYEFVQHVDERLDSWWLSIRNYLDLMSVMTLASEPEWPWKLEKKLKRSRKEEEGFILSFGAQVELSCSLVAVLCSFVVATVLRATVLAVNCNSSVSINCSFNCKHQLVSQQ